MIQFRRFVAAITVIYLGVKLILVPATFFEYLTNIGLLSSAATYVIMWAGH